MEKDKIFYEENGLITLQQGMEVEDLMLYGWGLTNDSSVKFTSSSGGFGDKCKDELSKYEETVSLKCLKMYSFLIIFEASGHPTVISQRTIFEIF